MRSHHWIGIGSAAALLAVAAGAFGAHGLKPRLVPESLAVFETAARYQMYHSLALIITGLIQGQSARKRARRIAAAGWCFLAGIVLFSGSLYALVLTDIQILGAVTPAGGIAFLAGWAALASIFLLSRKEDAAE